MLKAAIVSLKKTFTPSVLQEAIFFSKNGYVLHARFSEGLLKGRVRDTKGALYDVFIDFKSWPSHAARCGCHQKNCAHVAALLLSQEAQDEKIERSHKPFHVSFVRDEMPLREEKIGRSLDTFHWSSRLSLLNENEFTYSLEMEYEGKSINIAPLITALMERVGEMETSSAAFWNEKVSFFLPNGERVIFELERLKPYLQFLMQYGLQKLDNGLLHLSRPNLMLISKIEENISKAPIRSYGVKKIKELISEGAYPQEAEIPKELLVTLRPYQVTGLSWLQWLRRARIGGILADDMGLGKTLQTLALLQAEKEANRLTSPALIVVPKSLAVNWQKEAMRFTPSLRVLIYHGSYRHLNDIHEYDVIITTYGLVVRDEEILIKHTFHYLILDEAQWIKNKNAQATRTLYRLSAVHRLCLTGTPLENHLSELWSLFHFLMPGFLGDARWFRRFFEVPIQKDENKEQHELLISRIRPFILRRTKAEVEASLPPKTEIIYSVEFSKEERDLYEMVRLTMEKKVQEAILKQGLSKSRIIVLDALLRLRQICCDARLLKLKGITLPNESSKLEALLELLETLLSENRRALLFSQFTSMLDLIAAELSRRGIPFLMLTGKTEDRDTIVESFQKGKVPFLLMSLRAGGVGLNLTRADTVIHYDPWWNPAIEAQASDRSHRIGQEKPVFIYRFIVRGTVEEAVVSLQNKKRLLSEDILKESFGTSNWGLQDIDALFSKMT